MATYPLIPQFLGTVENRDNLIICIWIFTTLLLLSIRILNSFFLNKMHVFCSNYLWPQYTGVPLNMQMCLCLSHYFPLKMEVQAQPAVLGMEPIISFTVADWTTLDNENVDRAMAVNSWYFPLLLAFSLYKLLWCMISYPWKTQKYLVT